jgi:exoribonuclease-2
LTEGQIVLVPDGPVLRIGWVQSYKPGRPARVHVHAFGEEVTVVRIERRELAGELHLRTASLLDAEQAVQALLTRATPAELDIAWTLFADRPLGIGELAEVLFGKDDEPARDAATVLAIFAHTGFALERGRLTRRDAVERQELEAQRLRQAELDVDVAKWRKALHEHRAGMRVVLGDAAARLTAIVRGEKDPAAAHWLELDGRHKTADARDAADLLNELGLWDGHEDIDLWRSGVLAPWSEEAIASLRSEPDMPADAPRLTLPFVAMDNDAPHEVDDAICAEQTAKGLRVHVAIAHPSAWIVPDSAADLEARRRGATLYHPRHVVGMLPDRLAREDASLTPNVWRPALVVSFTLNAVGEPHDEQLQEAWVQVAHAWSYSLVERVLAGHPDPQVDRALLDLLVAAGQNAEAARIRNGAWLLYRPDAELNAPPFKPVEVRQVLQTSPGRRLVTEMMVQACAAVAQIGARHHLALPYRTQPRPGNAPLPPGLYDDPAQCFAMFRVLEAGTMQATPAPHGMMGVPAYVQFSSPLRRYCDVLAHRQLVAWLRGQPAPHTLVEVTQLAQTADEAARNARQWQRRGAFYFKLLWLAGRQAGQPLEGQVVRVLASGERLVFLPTLSLDTAVRGQSLQVGDHVQLIVRNVHPGKGTLELVVVGS